MGLVPPVEEWTRVWNMTRVEWAETPEGQAEGWTLNPDGSVSLDTRKLMASQRYQAIARLSYLPYRPQFACRVEG